MTSPAFNDSFNAFYDTYSVPLRDFSIPSHFDIYEPDALNQVDFQCKSVIVPSLEVGSKHWTLGAKWLTIGIYRDEGRAPAQAGAVINQTWSRSGTVLTITGTVPPDLDVGTLVNVYQTNVVSIMNATVISRDFVNMTFTINTTDAGPQSGTVAIYQRSGLTNFAKERIIFRLLPSFRAVPYSTIQALFLSTAPEVAPVQRQLYNFTLDTQIKLPQGKNVSFNYDPPKSSIPAQPNLEVRFNQQYNEFGKALPLTYLENGLPQVLNRVDSPYKNRQLLFAVPIIAEGDSDDTQDEFPYVYDFYGLLINDVARGPHFANDLITRNTELPLPLNNITRRTNGVAPFYVEGLYDLNANIVVGIQENNCVVSKVPILPLKLDAYNRPVKQPTFKAVQV